MKFGGTSVGSAESINRIKNILLKKLTNRNNFENEINDSQSNKIIIVVSAFAGVTNRLVLINDCLKNNTISSIQNIINEIYTIHTTVINNFQEYILNSNIKIKKDNNSINYINIIETFNIEFEKFKNLLNILIFQKEITTSHFDLILSFGEIFSSNIIYAYLKLQNIKIQLINSFQIYNFKKDINGNIEYGFIDNKTKKKVFKEIFKNDIVITQGFIANDYKNNIVTLGRGGSDLSASIIANLFEAETLEIWTDVSGILTSDPRKVQNTFTIKDIDYEIVKNMSYYGAKVLHPDTLIPTIEKDIKIKVLNTFDKGKLFTTIHKSYNNFNNHKLISIVFNSQTIFVKSKYQIEVSNIFSKRINNQFIYLLENTYSDILKLNNEEGEIINSNLSHSEKINLNPNKFIIEDCQTIYFVGVNNLNFEFISSNIIKIKKLLKINLLYIDFDFYLSTIILIIKKIDDKQFENLIQKLHNKLI